MLIREHSCSLRALLFVLAAIALAGCGADLDVTIDFYRGEEWEAFLEIAISADVLALAGGPGEIESQLDELVASSASSDVRTSWKKASGNEGELLYTIRMKGAGLEVLSQVVLDGNADIYVDESSGRRLVHFSQYTSTPIDFGSQSLTLRGGEIISGNGQLVDNQSITWENYYGRMEAVLTERSRFGLDSPLGIGAALLLVAGLVLAGVKLWQRKQTSSPAFCISCGAPIPEDARFCTNCGRAR
jgi:hypothetical protein